MRTKRPVRLLWVYMTAPATAVAQRLAEALVGERLAACVNLLSGVRSTYRWRGRVERARETVLIAKTRADRYSALCARVRELHPYEVPCIVAGAIERGHPAFLEWVAAESQPERLPPRRTRKRTAGSGRGGSP